MAMRLEAYQIMDCYLMAEVALTKIYKSSNFTPDIKSKIVLFFDGKLTLKSLTKGN